MSKPIKKTVKLDINFLDKPLYFQNINYRAKVFVWNDIEGYEYHSGFEPPDYVDMLILLYFLLKSQDNNYLSIVSFTRYEIIKACDFTKSPQTYTRIKDSLEKWSSVYIKFNGIFYDGQTYLTKFFHILKGSINEVTKKVEVTFDSDWLLKIKESRFFKNLNFQQYKALKRPITRRLFEILCKSFYASNEWSIHLTKLGAKLTISKRKVMAKNGEKEVLYASDVLVAIKPAINEINRLHKIPGIAKEFNLHKKDLFTLTYEIAGEKQDRVIIFHRHSVVTEKQQASPEAKPAQPLQQETKPSIAEQFTEKPITEELPPPPKPDQPKQQHEIKQEISAKDQAVFVEAIEWLRTIPYFNEKRRDEIALLPLLHVANRYPGIRAQYDKMLKAGKKPNPGWVYAAFKENYQFTEDIKQSQAEDKEHKRKDKQSHIQKIQKFIQDKGGISNLLYFGYAILEQNEAGLILANKALTLWDRIEMEGFAVIEA